MGPCQWSSNLLCQLVCLICPSVCPGAKPCTPFLTWPLLTCLFLPRLLTCVMSVSACACVCSCASACHPPDSCICLQAKRRTWCRFYLRAEMGVVGMHFSPLGGIDYVSKSDIRGCPQVSIAWLISVTCQFPLPSMQRQQICPPSIQPCADCLALHSHTTPSSLPHPPFLKTWEPFSSSSHCHPSVSLSCPRRFLMWQYLQYATSIILHMS